MTVALAELTNWPQVEFITHRQEAHANVAAALTWDHLSHVGLLWFHFDRFSISPVNRAAGYQREVGQGAWMVEQRMNRALSPREDFKQDHINQPGEAPVAGPCLPAISPQDSGALRSQTPPTHDRLTDTLTRRSSWTAVLQTEEWLQHRRWQQRVPQCQISPRLFPSTHICSNSF